MTRDTAAISWTDQEASRRGGKLGRSDNMLLCDIKYLNTKATRYLESQIRGGWHMHAEGQQTLDKLETRLPFSWRHLSI